MDWKFLLLLSQRPPLADEPFGASLASRVGLLGLEIWFGIFIDKKKKQFYINLNEGMN